MVTKSNQTREEYNFLPVLNLTRRLLLFRSIYLVPSRVLAKNCGNLRASVKGVKPFVAWLIKSPQEIMKYYVNIYERTLKQTFVSMITKFETAKYL